MSSDDCSPSCCGDSEPLCTAFARSGRLGLRLGGHAEDRLAVNVLENSSLRVGLADPGQPVGGLVWYTRGTLPGSMTAQAEEPPAETEDVEPVLMTYAWGTLDLTGLTEQQTAVLTAQADAISAQWDMFQAANGEEQ